MHIYTAETQPLTKPQKAGHIMRGLTFPAKPFRAKVRTHCCRKIRWAGHCGVQHFYDGSRVWCLPGKGCKKC